jgi:hypothetical protein
MREENEEKLDMGACRVEVEVVRIHLRMHSCGLGINAVCLFPARSNYGPRAAAGPTCEGYDNSAKLIVLKMAMKVSDLSHICSPLHMHQRWVSCLEEEMFQQGDMEKRFGMAPSPLCDREKGGITKSQVGFFKVVMMPLLTSFIARFPDARLLLDIASENLAHWMNVEASSQTL